MKRTLYILLLLTFAACAHKNTPEQTKKLSRSLVNDEFSLSGSYHWNFRLLGGTQNSIHSFYPDSITYTMKGRVYSTAYTMRKLSYEKDKNKWIGQDEDGIVYVLFFKNINKNSLTMYKHKCKSNGLAEAVHFKVPAPDATEDHGWNVYASTGNDQEDELPLNGLFTFNNQELVLSDNLVKLNNKSYEKLSYHAGERRWVGKSGSTYLQLFFEGFTHKNMIGISVTSFQNPEKAYRTKFKTVSFKKYQRIYH